MSLNTLLEAAKYLEQQEWEEQRAKEAALVVTQALTSTTPVPPPTVPQTLTITPSKPQHIANGQTVVISSSNISLQGPITISAPLAGGNKKEQDHQISSTVVSYPRHRILHNSFDIMNPLVIDEANGQEVRRRQPPMAFRSGTREVHNKLEKHRRAHLKECFDVLKKQLPQTSDEKKTSNLSILHHALRYIQTLKRQERELEHEMERLAREKISAQQKLAVLKKELSSHYDNIDLNNIIPDLSSPVTVTESMKCEPVTSTSVIQNGSNGIAEKVTIPILAKTAVTLPSQTTVTPIKEVTTTQPTVQTTQLSVLPISYPVNQGLVLQKVAIVPKSLTDMAPLVSTHFITTPQQLNGKVVPLTQYLVKPVVVVSTASPRPS